MNDPQQPETAVGWEEAARILGWKVETLKKRTAARTVPHVRHGKSISFVPSVLREWMVDKSLESLRAERPTVDTGARRKRRVHP